MHLMRAVLCALLATANFGCGQKETRQTGGQARLVFIHQPLGDPSHLEAVLDGFRRENPAVELVTQLLPNDSDVAHQYFLTALEGRSTEFDVLVVDVIWVAEFARAGWIRDVSDTFGTAWLAEDFLEGPSRAVTVEGKVYAVPWYVDVGLLYFRADLVPRAPRTYLELTDLARQAMAQHPSIQGVLWQGRQYEGLVCNVYEAIWGHGGKTLDDGRLLLDVPAARSGLTHLRSLIESGVSPPTITAATEEDVRRVFQSGKAVFMRNWPYAFAEAQGTDSPIRGKVGFAALPTASGEPGYGTLGGWQLAINTHVSSSRSEAARRLIRHLTSPSAMRTMALAYGRNPPRRSVYLDPQVQERAPFIAALLPIVERARPRPVSPYYAMLSDTLQAEFSAAISGIRPVNDALARAQRRADFVTETQ